MEAPADKEPRLLEVAGAVGPFKGSSYMEPRYIHL